MIFGASVTHTVSWLLWFLLLAVKVIYREDNSKNKFGINNCFLSPSSRPAPTRRVQQASVCSCDPASTLPQHPLEASGQSEPIGIDQWVSALTKTRGHDLSVANSVEHDAPDVKHAKHRSVGRLSRRARRLVCDALACTRWVRA